VERGSIDLRVTQRVVVVLYVFSHVRVVECELVADRLRQLFDLALVAVGEVLLLVGVVRDVE